MWDRAGDGHCKTYVPSERLIRISADLDDRDPLGRIWLRHERTLADILAQQLLAAPGVYIAVHDDRREVYACLEWALDDAGNLIHDAWVARPLGPEEVAELRARGA